MSSNIAIESTLDTPLLREAAEWAMIFQYNTPSDADYQAFEHWRQQSPAHEAAWARVQAVFHTFDQVPAAIRQKAVNNLEQGYDRRHLLNLLSALALVVPTGWLAYRQLPWQTWAADIATTTGEYKTIELPDGSRMVLNTSSAVNIAFGNAERRIRLVAGEILITTHTDSASTYRPFLVDTSCGVLRALGTRFSVRQLDQTQCRVAVFESAVEIRTLGGTQHTLQTGQQADFNTTGITEPVPVENTATLWEQGMLLARDMRLADVVTELARHRPGLLRCDPAVADLRISGALSLTDTDASLALLEKNLPVRISRATAYWVTINPRD